MRTQTWSNKQNYTFSFTHTLSSCVCMQYVGVSFEKKDMLQNIAQCDRDLFLIKAAMQLLFFTYLF